MLLTLTIADLDAALKDRNPDWLDSTSFATRRTSAAKQALETYYAGLRAANDIFARGSTLNGAAVSTGSVVFDMTGGGSVYRVAMASGQRAIAGDEIWLFKTTSFCVNVPRATPESIIVSGTGATTEVFWENNGELLLYSKDGDFTGPGSLHYNFFRDPTIDTTTPSNVIDIKPEDFTAFVDSVYSLIGQS